MKNNYLDVVSSKTASEIPWTMCAFGEGFENSGPKTIERREAAQDGLLSN